MYMDSKTYDILSWFSAFIPLVVTFVGTVLTATGVGESTTNMILIIIGAVGTFLNGTLKISSAHYYKNAGGQNDNS